MVWGETEQRRQLSLLDWHQNNDKLNELKKKIAKIKESRKFNLEPEKFSPEVNLKLFQTSFKKQAMRSKDELVLVKFEPRCSFLVEPWDLIEL